MFWRILDRFEVVALALLMAAMTIVTFAQVIMRYVFNDTFHWALEFVVVSFAWLIFLGISYGIRVGSHIGVEALVRMLRPQVARVLAIVAVVICMAYCAVLAWGGYQYVAKLHKIGILMQDLPIERWIPPAIIPIGFALAFLRFAQVLLRLVTGQDTKLHLADEAAEALQSDVNVHLHEDEASKENGGERRP